MRALYGRFADELGALRWTKHSVARRVAEYRGEVAGTFALHVPDLCADIGASASSRFDAAPSDATQFVERLQPDLRDGPEDLGRIASMMRPFLARRELYRVQRLEELEMRVNAVFNSDTNPLEDRLSRALGASR